MRRMRVLTRIFPASSIGAAQLTTEKGEPMKSNESKRNLHVGAAFVSILVALGACQAFLEAGSPGPTVQAPRFEVDPLWPKPLPNHWLQGLRPQRIHFESRQGLRPQRIHFESRRLKPLPNHWLLGWTIGVWVDEQ